jgi:hypothetical protein
MNRTPTADVIVVYNTGNFRIVAHVDGREALDQWIAGAAQAGIASPRLPHDLACGTTATYPGHRRCVRSAVVPAARAAAGVAQMRNLAILSAAAHQPSCRRRRRDRAITRFTQPELHAGPG